MARRRAISFFFVAAFGLLAALGGCGKSRPPAAGDETGVDPGSSGGLFEKDAGGTKPPGCGTAPDGTFCDCVDVPLFVDPPNMYFVLDRSGSMSTDDKWTQVRIVVGKILRGIGPRANFGAMIYPGGTTTCSPGAEIMETRPGDPPSSTYDGPTTQTLLVRTQVEPTGGTPTSATLQAVLPIVTKLPGKTFVILATDGAPNCNPTVDCTVDKCGPNIENFPDCPPQGPKNCCVPPDGFRENCLDDDATVAAAAALKQANVPVYVIGLPGSSEPLFAKVLENVAVAGGTESYYPVTAANETDMLGALKKVAAQIVATCEFKLKEAPSDPKLVNVYFDDVVVPHDPANAWDIVGDTVTLVGDACNRVKGGDVLDVRVIAGCPRVEPR